MRGLARFISTSTLVIGLLIAVVLAFIGMTSFDDYGPGRAFLMFGWAFGVFLSAGASACLLGLLASIDERLQAAGYLTSYETPANAQIDDEAVLREQFGAPGVKTSAADDLDPDLESKLNFQRTHGRN